MSSASSPRPLVFGGTGLIAREIIRLLVSRGIPTAATVRDLPKAKALLPPETQLLQADFADPASMQRAVTETRATSVYLYTEAVNEATVAALKAAGVTRVVKISTSFIGLPFSERMPLEDAQVAQETMLKAAGFVYTSLRAEGFSSNALRWKHSIAYAGVVKSLLVDVPIRYVAADDIAIVAADALATHDYDNLAAVTIQGPEPITARQQVDVIARLLDRPITLIEMEQEQYTAEFVQYMPEPIIRSVFIYGRFRKEHGPDEQAKTDKLVTGTMTFEQFIQKYRGELQVTQ